MARSFKVIAKVDLRIFWGINLGGGAPCAPLPWIGLNNEVYVQVNLLFNEDDMKNHDFLCG